jgi:hypothetical protein
MPTLRSSAPHFARTPALPEPHRGYTTIRNNRPVACSFGECPGFSSPNTSNAIEGQFRGLDFGHGSGERSKVRRAADGCCSSSVRP